MHFRPVLVPLLLFVAAGLSGCGGGASRGGQTEFISIGTADIGGSFYQIGASIADVLNDRKDEAGWKKVTAEVSGGSLENIRRLETGDVQIGMSNSSITYFAVRGEGGFDRRHEVKSIMTLHPLVAMFVTRADSGVQTLQDLKGRRVVIGPEGAGFEYFVGPILAEHRLSLEDVQVVHAGMETSVGYLQDGSVSATFLGGGLKSPAISSAASSAEIHLIPYDESARQELIRKYMPFEAVTVPAGTYRGIDRDYTGLNVGSTHLLVRSDADDEFVYRVTKIIYEGREKVAQTHAAGRFINAQNVVRDTGTEFHAGAIRYYREIGIWPEAGQGANAGRTSGEQQPAESDQP
ncbi:MAG TPA: TAXI family TRAP transporter solute-binding subunit [Planctomycetaceae bacterium]|nr:TAXI family TRAP transporter solute-binding subunit [Planctomycetaceae bacterium]